MILNSDFLVSVIVLILFGLVFTACRLGRNAEADNIPSVGQDTDIAGVKDENSESTTSTQEDIEESEGLDDISDERFEDNFDVGSETAKEFAMKIQRVTAAKDLEGLADLISFPVYIGLPEVV